MFDRSGRRPARYTQLGTGGAFAEAVRVKVAVPPGPTVDGLTVAVIPGGRIVGSSVAVPVYPPVGCMVMVVVAFDPGGRLRKDGFARSLKPGGSVTVRLSGAVALRLPLEPEIVSEVTTSEP
jgi:hypothetical protein